MIFSSAVSGGGFTLGTYAAQDYDLSEAEKYYTELAYNLNQKILKVSDSSDWKKGLTDFGANKKDLMYQVFLIRTLRSILAISNNLICTRFVNSCTE